MRVLPGVIEAWDRNTVTGAVRLKTGRRLPFHSTVFFSRPIRWPKAGEDVLVVVQHDDQEILSVRAQGY